jgi:TPR repeat protein
VKAARLVVTETNGGQRPEHRVALTQPLFLVSRRKPLNCDLLAAETDNNISVKGVEFDKIDTSAAIPACRADLAKERDNPRLIHNLARSLDKAGKKQEAVRLYRRAAELGFDWSQNNLSVMYMSGDGIDPDFGKAMFWLRKAFAQGNRQAIVNYTSTDMSELFSEDRERTLQLQRALKRLGLYHAAESGLFDNATKEALSAFKTGKDIRNEGITFQVMDALEITKLVLRRQ